MLRVVHAIHVRLAQYQIQILRLVGPCMSLAWWRHFRQQFFFDVHTFSSPFQRRPNGTEFPCAARIILASLCRAVRKQIASRREQYTIGGGEPRTRDEIFVGSSVSGLVRHTMPCLPRLETAHQLSRALPVRRCIPIKYPRWFFIC